MMGLILECQSNASADGYVVQTTKKNLGAIKLAKKAGFSAPQKPQSRNTKII